METHFPYVKIPIEFARLIGRPDEGTRIFRREGTVKEMREWFDQLCEHIGPCVSPGGAAVYAGVTRAGVNKRLKKGKLTIFCFYTIEKRKIFFGREKTIKDFPSGFIPVSECKAWGKDLEKKIERMPTTKTEDITEEMREELDCGNGDPKDWDSNFLNYDPHDKGRKGLRYRYPWETHATDSGEDEEGSKPEEK